MDTTLASSHLPAILTTRFNRVDLTPTIPEALRYVAETIPQREDQLVFDKSYQSWYGAGNTSIYICDNLDRLDNDGKSTVGAKARDFLHELGMGYGFSVFSDIPAGVERQRARVEWLLFAADIAEEWGVE